MLVLEDPDASFLLMILDEKITRFSRVTDLETLQERRHGDIGWMLSPAFEESMSSKCISVLLIYGKERPVFKKTVAPETTHV